MTHSPEVRREAIERLVMGESIASVSREMGIALGTVHEWKTMTLEAVGASNVADLRKRAIAEDATEATENAIALLRELLADKSMPRTAELVRSAGYAAEKLSNIALDWTVGRRGFGGVTIAAGNVVSLPDGLTLDELRAIAAPGPDVSTPLIVNHE